MVTAFTHSLIPRGVLPLGEGKQIGYHFARFAGIHGSCISLACLPTPSGLLANSDNSVLALIYKSLMIKDAEHFPVSLFRNLMQSGASWQWRYILEKKKHNTKLFLSVFKRTHTNRDHVLWLILRNHCHVGSHWSVIWCRNRNFSKVSVQVFFFFHY